MSGIKRELYGNSYQEEKHLFLFDIHAPYEDIESIYVIYKFIYDYKPDFVHIVGDFQDCEKISRFIRDPFNRMTFSEEVDHAQLLLQDIAKCCRKANKNVSISLYMGNHEERLQKYIATNAEQLAGLHIDGKDILSIPYLYQLHELNVNWVPISSTIHGIFRVEHGDVVRKESAYSARIMEDKRRISGISGHTHRVGMYTRTSSQGTTCWLEAGCLCKMNPKYIIEPNWEQGFAFGIYNKQKNIFYTTQVLIQNHSFMVGNKLYA